MSKKILVLCGIITLVVGLFGGYAIANLGTVNFAGLTHFSGVSVGADGFEVTDSGATTLGGAVTVTGVSTLNGGTLRSYTNSTSTTMTAQTLAVGDILKYDTILMTPNTGALTLTLPASSTLSTLVPAAGDMQETCIVNSTSTAAATITLATGTGIALQRVATSTTSGTAGMLAIPANGSACIKFVRQKATATAFDIQALVTLFINAE